MSDFFSGPLIIGINTVVQAKLPGLQILGFYHQEAPTTNDETGPPTPRPYCVFDVGDGQSIGRGCGTANKLFPRVRMRFHGHDDIQVINAAADFNVFFGSDLVVIPMSNGEVIDKSMVQERIPRQDERGWTAELIYEITVTGTRNRNAP